MLGGRLVIYTSIDSLGHDGVEDCEFELRLVRHRRDLAKSEVAYVTATSFSLARQRH